MIQKLRNTKERGLFRFIVFKEKDDDYCAVCLDLNIVEYGKDPEMLKKSIFEAAFSYLEAVRKENLSDEFLNKPAPKRFWNKAMKQSALFCQCELPQKSLLTTVNFAKNNSFCSVFQPYSNNGFDNFNTC